MDWGAVSAVAGMLTALFVGFSVVYLALQIKASTQATRASGQYLVVLSPARDPSLVEGS